MAAGLGFKDFVTGEVLTAADVDGYLMQGIWVFASAAARDSAVTSPQEGNFAYLKDTNTTTYYTGSAWTNLDTTGMVNPMTTTGDTIYSSSGSTPARLGIGSTGQVLTVAGGVPSWATPASGGGLTLIQEQTASSSTAIDFTSISGSYTQLLLTWQGINTSASTSFSIRFNSDTSSIYATAGLFLNGTSASFNGGTDTTCAANPFGDNVTGSDFYNRAKGSLLIDNYASTTKLKYFKYTFEYTNAAGPSDRFGSYEGTFNSTSAITAINIYRSAGSGSFTNATNTSIRLYGIS